SESEGLRDYLRGVEAGFRVFGSLDDSVKAREELVEADLGEGGLLERREDTARVIGGDVVDGPLKLDWGNSDVMKSEGLRSDGVKGNGVMVVSAVDVKEYVIDSDELPRFGNQVERAI